MITSLPQPPGIPHRIHWPHHPGLLSVTFTGVDETTSFSDLARLSATCPAIEWGVLYSHQRAGKEGRYPSLAWIQALQTQWDPRWRRALHLCGSAAHDWIAGDPTMRELAKLFDRVQLNVVGDRTDQAALRQALEAGAHPAVITQHHAANQGLTDALSGCPQHAVLFDGSGGRGRLPEQWPTPVPGKAVGYAGGLGPATIAQQAQIIGQRVAGHAHWLDMEQALRDAQDRFDPSSVARVIEALDEIHF